VPWLSVCRSWRGPKARTLPSRQDLRGALEIRDGPVIDGSGAPTFGPVNVYSKGNRIERILPVDSVARKENEEEGVSKGGQEAPDRVMEEKGM
jgi:hypothetical protein